MPCVGAFQGFSLATAEFYRDLALNNNKEWFDENRERYDGHVIKPARRFVAALGDMLVGIAPGINADPRINKSIFRINRDTRFSKDKTPYKTHLGIWLWEGNGKRMEYSGFYFHLEPPEIMLGCGIYCFPKYLLAPYREAAADPKKGAELVKAIQKVKAAGDYDLSGLHYKRVPRGYPKDHPNAELLRHNGLAALARCPIPDEFTSAKLVEYCYKRYADMLPLHRWLRELTQEL